MKQFVRCLFLSAFLLPVGGVFAQNSDQPSPDSGVLVSPPIQEQGAEQDNNKGSKAPEKMPGATELSNTLSTDDIVTKATHAVILQMTANLKLTQDQITAAQPVIADNITRIRDLEQSLKNGVIDSSEMNSQKEQLNKDEDVQLSSILTSDQMKGWLNIQNHTSDHHKPSSSK